MGACEFQESPGNPHSYSEVAEDPDKAADACDDNRDDDRDAEKESGDDSGNRSDEEAPEGAAEATVVEAEPGSGKCEEGADDGGKGIQFVFGFVALVFHSGSPKPDIRKLCEKVVTCRQGMPGVPYGIAPPDRIGEVSRRRGPTRCGWS